MMDSIYVPSKVRASDFLSEFLNLNGIIQLGLSTAISSQTVASHNLQIGLLEHGSSENDHAIKWMWRFLPTLTDIFGPKIYWKSVWSHKKMFALFTFSGLSILLFYWAKKGRMCQKDTKKIRVRVDLKLKIL